MNEESLTSVSKGCFIVRGKRKKKNLLDLNPANYFPSSESSSESRWELSRRIWSEIEAKIKSLHSKLTADIFNDLLNFMKKSHNSNREFGGKRAEIPSAALITGVNMPDHTGFFNQLSEEVAKSITPHVAVLCAKNCPNMKSLMRCIGQQLILGESEDLHNISIDEAGDLETDKCKNFMWKRSTPLTMPLLEKWFSQADHSLESRKAKKKKKNNSQNLPTVVIMLRDMESFLPHLLQDLITMFSTVIETFPVIFVFGVATSWTSVVDRQLPHSATVHLCLEKFYSPPASQHLAMVIDNILLTSDYSFKLSGKCMQLLLDVFLCHDFSVTNFLHILKFCVLDHFYDQSASLFCINDMTQIENHLKNLTTETLNQLRNLASVKIYMGTLTTKRKQLLQSSDNDFKVLLKKMLEDLHGFHQCFYPVMLSLFCLCKSLPRHPLGRHLRELYCACDHSTIVNSEEYKQAKMFLRVTSREQLIERLQACIKELEDLPQSQEREAGFLAIVTEARSNIGSFIDDLINLENLKEDDSFQNEEEDEENKEQKSNEPLEKVKYAYQLKENLKKKAQEKKVRKMSNFEKIRMKVLEVLDDLFIKVLIPPRSFPFHEVFYFDSTSTIRRHMVAAPRLAIQTALSEPNYYLRQPCLDVTDGVIPPSAPDVSIAYKLHNECGRIINLYDWLEAFHTIVNSGDNSDDNFNNKENEEINEVTQARFIRAASELQFLGFIKPTKRKTDHVQRLTWSHS